MLRTMFRPGRALRARGKGYIACINNLHETEVNDSFKLLEY